MKALLLISLIVLAGCTTTPVVVTKPLEPLPCGKDLKPETLQACADSLKLADGAVFANALDQNAAYKKALRDCNVKVTALVDVIKACQQVR